MKSQDFALDGSRAHGAISCLDVQASLQFADLGDDRCFGTLPIGRSVIEIGNVESPNPTGGRTSVSKQISRHRRNRRFYRRGSVARKADVIRKRARAALRQAPVDRRLDA